MTSKADLEQLDSVLEQKGLAPSTRLKYTEILDTAPKNDLVGWIDARVRARTPIGTVLPMRAAVSHYLISILGYRQEDVDQLLPDAAGAPNESHRPLTDRGLALYHAAVEQIDREPAHTLLQMLPLTGLKISEICNLRMSHIRNPSAGSLHLALPSSSGMREIPLQGIGQQVLSDYLTHYSPSDFLFTGYGSGPIGPHAVRKYTRRIAASDPDLSGLCPEMLRATYARLALARGMDLEELRRIMGHTSIQSTARYAALAS